MSCTAQHNKYYNQHFLAFSNIKQCRPLSIRLQTDWVIGACFPPLKVEWSITRVQEKHSFSKVVATEFYEANRSASILGAFVQQKISTSIVYAQAWKADTATVLGSCHRLDGKCTQRPEPDRATILPILDIGKKTGVFQDVTLYFLCYVHS